MANPNDLDIKFTQMSIDTEHPSTSTSNRFNCNLVALIHSKSYEDILNIMPKIDERASLVYSLIQAYNISHSLNIISPTPANITDLLEFHSKHYILALKQVDEQHEADINLEEYNLGYDCPIFEGVYKFACASVGGTLTAVNTILENRAKIAINWGGGWHHAQRTCASGFCYFNDVVLGILKLHEKFNRILYIDLDLHHGNGVQDAFYYTSKVMCLSFHKLELGFYPGTGGIDEKGAGNGEYFNLNIPLKDGLDDPTFCKLLEFILPSVYKIYSPTAVVVQCGADGLALDPMDSFNLTEKSFLLALTTIASWQLPMLVLGGGGYNFMNTAKLWTHLTASLAGLTLNLDIPDHEYFLRYAPDYSLTITPGCRTNYNIKSNYMDILLSQVMSHLTHTSEHIHY